jgi:hypothetical protein
VNRRQVGSKGLLGITGSRRAGPCTFSGMKRVVVVVGVVAVVVWWALRGWVYWNPFTS